MYSGLYAASSNMGALIHEQDVIAANVANAGVSGYKAERLAFRSFPEILFRAQGGGQADETGASGRVGTGSGVDWSYTYFAPGRQKETGVPTDMLITGDAYFTVKDTQGRELLTKGGSFVRQPDGTLTSPEGYILLDTNRQPVKMDGPFTVNQSGGITRQDGGAKTQLLLQTVDNQKILLRQSGAAFSVEDKFQKRVSAAGPNTFTVYQGVIEESNVSPLTEMSRLIAAYRNYESSARVLSSIDKTMERLVNDVGRSGR